MKLCGDGCFPICDFCGYFESESMGSAEGYNGDGWCKLKSEPTDPCYRCDDFECFTIN